MENAVECRVGSDGMESSNGDRTERASVVDAELVERRWAIHYLHTQAFQRRLHGNSRKTTPKADVVGNNPRHERANTSSLQEELLAGAAELPATQSPGPRVISARSGTSDEAHPSARLMRSLGRPHGGIRSKRRFIAMAE